MSNRVNSYHVSSEELLQLPPSFGEDTKSKHKNASANLTGIGPLFKVSGANQVVSHVQKGCKTYLSANTWARINERLKAPLMTASRGECNEHVNLW